MRAHLGEFERGGLRTSDMFWSSVDIGKLTSRIIDRSNPIFSFN